MKKSLVVLLALVMVLAFAATAVAANPGSGDTQIASYTDLADTKDEWAAAVYKLTALGVLQGDGIGTKYRPADNLTRGEFAVIATYLAGVEDQVAFYATKPAAFSDANGWEKGYVNCAYANDLMIGRSATKFDPKGKVSMQEVATVVLRVLGYNFDSTYPVGYANKAEAIGLLDYVQYVGPTYINRAEMASIAAQALDCYKVAKATDTTGLGNLVGIVDEDGYKYVGWKTNETATITGIITDTLKGDLDNDTIKKVISSFFEKYTAVPLLYSVFGCVDVQAVFNYPSQVNNDKLEAAGWGYTNFKTGQIAANIAGFTFIPALFDGNDRVPEVNIPSHIPFADEYYIYEGDLVDLGGRVGTLTLDMAKAGKVAEIKFIDLDDELILSGTKEYFSYDKWNKQKTTSGISYYNVVDYADYKGDAYGIVKSNGSASFVAPTNPAKSVDTDNNIVFWNMDTKQFVTPADLAKGDVVYYAGTVGNSYFKVDADLYLVYSGTTGTLSTYSQEFATIGGTKYKALWNNDTAYSKYSVNNLVTVLPWNKVDGLNTEVTFAGSYVPGYFTYVANATTSYIYGVVDEYLYKDRADSGRLYGANDQEKQLDSVEILLPSGEIATYPINDKVAPNKLQEVGALAQVELNKNGEVVAMTVGDSGAPFIAVGNVKGTTFDYNPTTIEVTKNDGLVINNKNTSYKLNSDAVIYVLESADNDYMYDINSAKVITAADFIAAYAGKTVNAAYAFVAKGNALNGVDVLYIIEITVVEDGFGAGTSFGHYLNATVDETTKFVEIDDKVFTCENKLFDAICEGIEGTDDFLIVYKAENGELVKAAIIERADLQDNDKMHDVYWLDTTGKTTDRALTGDTAKGANDIQFEFRILADEAELDGVFHVGFAEINDISSDNTRIEVVPAVDDTKDARPGDKNTLSVNASAMKEEGTIMYIYKDGDFDKVVLAYIYKAPTTKPDPITPGGGAWE